MSPRTLVSSWKNFTEKLEIRKFCDEEGVTDGNLKHDNPSALPLTLIKYFENELFAITGTIYVSKKMEGITDGSSNPMEKMAIAYNVDGFEVNVRKKFIFIVLLSFLGSISLVALRALKKMGLLNEWPTHNLFPFMHL